jgi:hypothetical protein
MSCVRFQTIEQQVSHYQQEDWGPYIKVCPRRTWQIVSYEGWKFCGDLSFAPKAEL